MRLRPLALSFAVAVGGLVGCQGENSSSVEPVGSVSSGVPLPNGDACGDAYFWAASESDDVAVTLFLDERERSRDEVTTVVFALPDPNIEVAVLHGHDLSKNFCTDVLVATSEPSGRQMATAGEGKVTLDPRPNDRDGAACGTITGELELSGLIAEDGTTFVPFEVTSDSIGCYSG